jgi:hypothetical protein
LNHESILFSPSPYNIPTGVRYIFEPEQNKRMIEFRYLDGSEPSVSKKQDLGFAVEFGKKSHRIFSVCLNGENWQTTNPAAFIQAITQALNGLPRNETPKSNDNLTATRSVIATFGDELLKTNQ